MRGNRGNFGIIAVAILAVGCGERVGRTSRSYLDGPLPTMPGGTTTTIPTTTTTSPAGTTTTTTSPSGSTTTSTGPVATTTTTTKPTTTTYVPGPLPVAPVPIPSPGTGALIHVDSSVASSGDGSAAAPFKTIQEGLNVAQPGESVVVHGDASGSGRVYSTGLSFPTAGSAGAPVTLRAADGEKVIISWAAAISFNRDHLLIKDLIFDHMDAATDFFKVSGKNVTFDGVEVRNGQRDGFEIMSTSMNTIIARSKIHDFQWYSTGGVREDAHCIVTNPGASFFYLMNNDIFDCTGDCIQFYGEDSTPWTSYVHDALVYGNRMHTSLGANSENAIDVKGLMNSVVRANDIYGFTGNKAVVFQKGSKDILFTENFVHDSQRGLEVRKEGGKAPSEWEISHNVFYRMSGLTAGSYAIKTDGVTDVTIVHNTVVETGEFMRNELGGITNGVIRNNLSFNAAAPRIRDTWVNVTVSNNGWFNTPAGALAGSGDVTGTDPLLDSGFKPLMGSPVIDKGFNLGKPFNFAAPDLGAKEY